MKDELMWHIELEQVCVQPQTINVICKCSEENVNWQARMMHLTDRQRFLPCIVRLVQCSFKTCLFGTGQLRGLRYCCMQLFREPLVQTTWHSTCTSWVLSNTPTKCEVDQMNGCRNNQRTDRQRVLPFIGKITSAGAWTFEMGPLLVSRYCCLQHCQRTWPLGAWLFGEWLFGAGWLLTVSVVENHNLAACSVLETALPWVLGNRPTKREVDQMNGCWDMQMTVIHVYIHIQIDISSFIVRWCCYSNTYWRNGTKFVMVTQTSYLHMSTKCGCNSTKWSGDIICFVM